MHPVLEADERRERDVAAARAAGRHQQNQGQEQ
jgi:hypothetical protein